MLHSAVVIMVDGPLAGVKVLDLTHVWAGPLAVRFLADYGADVIRVEAPDSRGPREVVTLPIGGWLGGAPGSEPWNTSARFAKFMRNRRSVSIDLKTAAGRAVFLQLAAQADVLVENFSAAVMANLQLDDAVLRAVNPQLIYVSVSGFGHSGPLSDRVAFGPIVEVMSGFTDVFGFDSDDAPRNTALAVPDPIAGLHAVAAVTEALTQRLETGVGTKIEVTLQEGGVTYCAPWILDAQLGLPVGRWGNRHPNMAPHGIYRCFEADAWVAIACENDTQWQALVALLGGDPNHASRGGMDATWSLAVRQANCDLIDTAIADWTAAQSKTVVAERLQQAGVPAGPVNTTPDMTADEQVRAREFFVCYEPFGVPMPGNPVTMSGLDQRQWTPCPKLGADNAEVLAEWLGMAPDEIEVLHEQGVLHTQPPA